MLELLLLRHAKSDRGDPTLDDHDRDLAPRGVRAAALIGCTIRDRGLAPDLVLCSTARRARRTWELVLAELAAAPAMRDLASLYLAPPERILGIVRREGRGCARVMVVGHDPGLHRLTVALAGSGDAGDLERLGAKFPTAALARLAFAAESWDAVAPGTGRLLDFLRPRDLKHERAGR